MSHGRDRSCNIRMRSRPSSSSSLRMRCSCVSNTTDILQDAGYHVLEARDGVEAIAILELRSGDVSALFTDIAMPNMNGVALAKVVSERWPHIGILLTSGAMPVGVPLDVPDKARFLPKPYTPEKLLRELRSVLPQVGNPITIKSLPTIPPGRELGAGGLAQPLPKPEE